MQPGDLRFRKNFQMMSDGCEIVLGGEIFVFETELKARTIGLSDFGDSGHRATQNLVDMFFRRYGTLL